LCTVEWLNKADVTKELVAFVLPGSQCSSKDTLKVSRTAVVLSSAIVRADVTSCSPSGSPSTQDIWNGPNSKNVETWPEYRGGNRSQGVRFRFSSACGGIHAQSSSDAPKLMIFITCSSDAASEFNDAESFVGIIVVRPRQLVTLADPLLLVLPSGQGLQGSERPSLSL
jgi:hypothetical protein